MDGGQSLTGVGIWCVNKFNARSAEPERLATSEKVAGRLHAAVKPERWERQVRLDNEWLVDLGPIVPPQKEAIQYTRDVYNFVDPPYRGRKSVSMAQSNAFSPMMSPETLRDDQD